MEAEQWAVVELLGHGRIAGGVVDQGEGDTALIVVVVPETRPRWWYTIPAHGRLVSVRNALFSVHLCTEEVARAEADRIAHTPPGFQAPPRPVPPLPEPGQRCVASNDYDADSELHGLIVDEVTEEHIWYHAPGEEPKRWKRAVVRWRGACREIQTADGVRVWPGPEYPDAVATWETTARSDDGDIPW